MSQPNPPAPKSRHRFWLGLGVWSLLVAGVTVYWQAADDADWTWNSDGEISPMRLAGGFSIIFSLVLLSSYLLLGVWKKRPTSRKAWFWLGLASVAGGIYWCSWFIRLEIVAVRDFSSMNYLAWILIWSVIFLTGALVLFTLRHFFRWLCRWRTLKWLLRGLAALLLLAAGFYAEENWRGRRAWDSYRRQLEAQGEHLDLAYFIPPSVPDDQNFAMAPVVASCYGQSLPRTGQRIEPPDTNVVNRLKMEIYRTGLLNGPYTNLGDWQKGTLTDLNTWQTYYRTMFMTNRWESLPPGMPPPPSAGSWPPPPAESVATITNEEVVALTTNEFPIAPQSQSAAADVLFALSQYDSALAELLSASQLPYSRFPYNYATNAPNALFCPHLESLKSCASTLRLRAIAELANDQAELALADVQIILRLASAIRQEPSQESFDQQLALIKIALQPIWEGLARRQWSANQLAVLESKLAEVDAVKDYAFALRAGLAASLEFIEHLRIKRMANPITCMCGDIMWEPTLFYWLAPSGWFHLSARTSAEIFAAALPTSAEVEQRILSPNIKDRFMRAIWQLERSRFLPDNVCLSFVLPLDQAAMNAAHIQAGVDMARIACALERYRQAQNGVYPEHLDDLMPQFMKKFPHDIINGQPLHYRRTEAGSFLLYSVGWNGKDDNGTPGDVKQTFQWQSQGDWVWQYPAK